LGLTGFVASRGTISDSPFGREVLVLAIAQGMFSAVSNATTRVHSRGRGGVEDDETSLSVDEAK
jgi:hypothetical protein